MKGHGATIKQVKGDYTLAAIVAKRQFEKRASTWQATIHTGVKAKNP